MGFKYDGFSAGEQLFVKQEFKSEPPNFSPLKMLGVLFLQHFIYKCVTSTFLQTEWTIQDTFVIILWKGVH